MTEIQDSQVDRVLVEQRREDDNPAVSDPHPDRTREFRTPGFSRMRLDWAGDDGAVIANVVEVIDQILLEQFPVAFEVRHEIFSVVREPEVDTDTGEVREDNLGFPIWRRNPSGTYVENWSLLTDRLREDSLHKITLYLVEWEDRQADFWGEAMFAKSAWEERFATLYLATPGVRPTVDACTAHGRAHSMEERYFAIYKSLLSRKVDALVRSMERLCQRLKDTTIR